jgi:hypothetical protein
MGERFIPSLFVRVGVGVGVYRAAIAARESPATHCGSPTEGGSHLF